MPRRGDNIRKRKDGRWEGRYMVITENGNKKYISVYAPTYRSVKDKLEHVRTSQTKEREKLFCEFIDNKQEKLPLQLYEVAMEEWLDEIKENRKYSTYVKYKSICYKYIFPVIKQKENILWKKNTIQMEISNINSLSNSMKRSITSIIHEISCFAVEKHNLLPMEIAVHYERIRKEETEIFTKEEQKKLIRFLNRDMDISKLGIMLCLSTGIRLGEVCALKWCDVDSENACLYINRTVQRIAIEDGDTKTTLMITPPKSVHSVRKIPLSQSMQLLLNKFYIHKSGEYLWNKNKPLDPRTYQKRFQSYLKEAGIRSKNFHILRHTFATNCIANGMDVKCLSEILGHSDVKITLNRYVHPSMEMKRQYMDYLSDIYGQYLGHISLMQ